MADLRAKVAQFTDRLHDHYQGAIAVYPSIPTGFRMRAEFRILHNDHQAYYAMTYPGSKRPYPVTTFPIGSTLINQLMPALLGYVNDSIILRDKLFAVEFLTTSSGDGLVTLIYHRRLDTAWEERALHLQHQLDVAIMGRSRKQRCVLSRDYVTETLQVGSRHITYRQVESAFTQPNATINEKMLAWANQRCVDSTGDLLELYCGNGNFTVALAHHFQRVLATEISKTSVQTARYNLEQNNVCNVELVRMSSEDIAQAIDGVRPFRRLAHIELEKYSFSTLFVDPPRAGLDAETLSLATRFERILYISCNPSSLMDNVRVLAGTHRITASAAFDQFPWTPHLEVGLILERIDSPLIA